MCPIYRVVVFKDGRMDYEGTEFVKQKGHASGRLSAMQLQEIEAAFEASEFCTLDPNYSGNSVDAPVVTTTYSGCVRPKTVVHDEADERAPRGLAVMEDRVDSILETSRWVGTDAERSRWLGPDALDGWAQGDRHVAPIAGGESLLLRADGGWAITASVPDGGYARYVAPIAKPPSYLINLADAGWVSETPLVDGGWLRAPAATPPGY